MALIAEILRQAALGQPHAMFLVGAVTAIVGVSLYNALRR